MIGLLVTVLLSGSTIKVADAAAPPLPPLTMQDGSPFPNTAVPRSRPYFPERAILLGKGGKADIKCVITQDHVITQCVILTETPPKWGFGTSAVELFTGMKVPDTTKSGEPTAGREYLLHADFKVAG
jgi:hypothetical protein